MAAAAIAVVVLGVPLAVAVRPLIIDLSLRGLHAEAMSVAAFLEQQDVPFDVAEVALTRFAQATGSEVAIVGAGGTVIARTSDFPAGFVRAMNGRDRAAEGGRLHVVVPTTVLGGRVDLHVNSDASVAERRVRQVWLSIAVVAGTALLVAAAAGSWQARQLARPLERLADGARQLGDGDFSARAPRSGLPEPDMVADALDSTAERLGVLVERANSFSADASHQLRTPLTALRLNIESLRYSPERDDLIDEALRELDRLDATITELLTLASPATGGTVFDVQELVLDRLDAWAVLAEAAGRSVHTEFETSARVRARPAAVGQALQVLLDNALAHGRGTITVSVAVAPDTDERWIRLCVRDEGPGFDERRLPAPPPADRATSGRGLWLARSLITAEGGSLRVGRTLSGACVCLLVPAAAGAAADVKRPPT